MSENPNNAPPRQTVSREGPASGPHAGEAEAADGLPKRTDPRTFVVQALQVIPRSILPLVAVAFATRAESQFGLWIMLGIGGLILALSTVFTFLGWWRQTYRVGDSDIRLETGVLSRAARSVPYDRIQDVSLEQGFIPRLFGLTEVKFETGAGGSEEIRLAYLTSEEGARLRELVRELRDEAEGVPRGDASVAKKGEAAAAESEAPVLFSMGPRRLLTFGLFEFSLAFFAVLAGLAQQFDSLLPFDIWDVETWQEVVGTQGKQLSETSRFVQALTASSGVILLILIGFATGILRTFLRDWNFRLERNPKGFRRRRGMFTRTDVVMPVHRVQAVQIATGAVRHRFGWKSLKLVSLAQDSGDSSHVVAPFAKASELTPILKVAGFPLPPRGLQWHRTTAAYRVKSALFGMAGYLVLAAGVAAGAQFIDGGRFDWLWLIAMAIAAFSAFAAIRQLFLWRVERHALSPHHLYKRTGWFAPGYKIADRVKLQSVEISRGPLGRMFGYVTLNLGLAGGYFALPGIPRSEADALRNALLASMVEKDFSRLVK
ncbi:MAG: PH domain-containing protein [Erythrobacter sp.]|nr:PH domain-containing protein [Erythrobacter sp.]NCQ63236.1 PH domain-containing protein [Alphaproteobacteria bacterium]